MSSKLTKALALLSTAFFIASCASPVKKPVTPVKDSKGFVPINTDVNYGHFVKQRFKPSLADGTKYTDLSKVDDFYNAAYESLSGLYDVAGAIIAEGKDPNADADSQQRINDEIKSIRENYDEETAQIAEQFVQMVFPSDPKDKTNYYEAISLCTKAKAVAESFRLRNETIEGYINGVLRQGGFIPSQQP